MLKLCFYISRRKTQSNSIAIAYFPIVSYYRGFGPVKIAPQKITPWKIAPRKLRPMKIAPYENTHLWKFPPLKIPPSENRPLENCPQEKSPQKINPRKLPPMKVATIVMRDWKLLPCSGGPGFHGSTDTYLIWHG